METKIVYQAGNVAGGFAFSANKPEIILSGYVENLADEMKEIAIFIATTARDTYVNTVAAKKAAGEKVNPLTIKREAVKAAKEAAAEKFGEENYNAFVKIEEDNKGGVVPISGKKPSKGEKAAKPAKVSKVSGKPKKAATAEGVELTDADVADLEKEFEDSVPDESTDSDTDVFDEL